MSTIRFLSITFFVLIAIATCSAEATDYIISFTDGSNRVGYFVLKSNGASITALKPVSFKANARIGTTTPYKLNNDVLVHHTSTTANGKPIYAVAVFDFLGSTLKQNLSFQNFGIFGFYPLKVYGIQPRTMYAKTANDTSSALLSGSGTPAGAKKPIFNNPTASDLLFGADVSKDGNWAVQTVSKEQGFLRQNQIHIRRVSNGGGTGAVGVVTISHRTYSPSLSGPIPTSGAPNTIFRWLGFRVFVNQTLFDQDSAVYIGKIDDKIGRLFGPLKLVSSVLPAPQSSAESFPSVLVSPDGTFVIYTAYNNSCKKQILILQRINPQTGDKVGPQKTLIGCGQLTNIAIGLYGIDILRIG
jgi:hypothetical protein